MDQTPIRRGSNAHEALQESIALAKAVDKLGYTRYWLSEHHNMNVLACAAPEIMIARLASETTNLRFGSGGIMLPNHSTLKVSENFRLLEALYPGRIDIGIGRAPGGDRLTSSLLNPSNTFNPQDYVQQIIDLRKFMSGDTEEGTVHEKVKAIPSIATVPEFWMLTSSGESAYIAAHFGMALSYAQFINPIGGPEAIRAYREKFRPSAYLERPQTSAGIFVFCGDTDEKVREVQAVMDFRFLSIERGLTNESPSYESVKDYHYSPQEMMRIQQNRARMITGTAANVKQKIMHLARTLDVEEIVIATFADTAEDRMRSYHLISKEFGL